MANLDDYQRTQIAEENKKFSYGKFLGGGYEDCGATGIITSNQSVTIMNDKNGMGAHDKLYIEYVKQYMIYRTVQKKIINNIGIY